MFNIINKQILAEDIKRIDIIAPEIARRALPGQFVIAMPNEDSERIPLSIIESDVLKGTISLIFQELGETTRLLGNKQINDEIAALLGPLGVPVKMSKVGLVVCIANGVGTAQILPICRANKKAGNKVTGIIGAKSKRSLMLEPQMRLTCDKLLIATNDGSYERKGLATDLLREMLNTKEVQRVYAMGSVDMMETVTAMTKVKQIPTLVSLNPMMYDGTGMCGSCRVKVKGEIVLACVDGPVFNGHDIDFQDLRIRMNAYGDLKECYSQKSSQPKEEAKIFSRFLSGILKR